MTSFEDVEVGVVEQSSHFTAHLKFNVEKNIYVSFFPCRYPISASCQSHILNFLENPKNTKLDSSKDRHILKFDLIFFAIFAFKLITKP